jgi:serine/threonine protein kinase
MNYLLPLLSVIIGYLIALLLKPKAKQNLKLLLAFSGSFLLSLTMMNLLPEVYESDKYIHLVFEYLEGGELFERIKSKGLYHEKDATNVMRNLLKALDYLH